MSLKHTPGPWHSEDYEIGADDGSVIAHVNCVDDFPCIGENNDPEQMAQLEAELDANARLIAGAPTLLQVLKDAEFYASHQERACRSGEPCVCGYEEWWVRFNAAIAKAEGGA